MRRMTNAVRGLTFKIEMIGSIHPYYQKASAVPAIPARFSFFTAKP